MSPEIDCDKRRESDKQTNKTRKIDFRSPKKRKPNKQTNKQKLCTLSGKKTVDDRQNYNFYYYY
jgi:hypothetical protein